MTVNASFVICSRCGDERPIRSNAFHVCSCGQTRVKLGTINIVGQAN